MISGTVYHAELEHCRLAGAQSHRFVYPVLAFSFDLSSIRTLTQKCKLFSFNRWNVLSLRESDFLLRNGQPLELQVREIFSRSGKQVEFDRIELVTSPRYLGWVFNPASFFYCLKNEEVVALLAEVNNTFGERHFYALVDGESDGKSIRYKTDKSFYVSPFYDVSGSYEFAVSKPEPERLSIAIRKFGASGVDFFATLRGKGAAMTTSSTLRALARFPFSLLLVYFRIHYQAFILYFRRRLPVHTKPLPLQDLTLTLSPPSLRERWAMNFVFKALQGITGGRLVITLPDGHSVYFGNEGEKEIKIRVRSYRFFLRTALQGDIGFGESFTAGEWTSPDLTALIELLTENMDLMWSRAGRGAWLFSLVARIRHMFRSNTRVGSKKNIRSHYDLSNKMYKCFLDESMTYSCAVYSNLNEPLEIAQRRKLEMIIEKLHLESTDHLLEIGSGWGSFALLAAQQTGCRVTSITLSEEQLREATERAEAAGLSDRVEFKLCDYRDMTGQFDKIVSIEMLEAVGERFIPVYFRKLEELLRPNGIALVQVITMPENRYQLYRKGCDWIQRHIFPGAFLPSLTALLNSLSDNTQLVVEDIENIGVNYARTLEVWRERFLAKHQEVLEAGFTEEFIRAWTYYFSYCEAAFRARALGDHQIVLTRPLNKRLPQLGRLSGSRA